MMTIGSMFMLISLLILLSIVLRTLKNLKLNFFKFFIGSLGVFTIAMIFFMNPLDHYLGKIITTIMAYFADLSGGFEVYSKNALLLIDAKGGIVSMLINYECSGVIELLVYSCLVLFFPFVTKGKKLWAFIWGNVYIMICNVIRLLTIIMFVKWQGIAWYNISHTIIGRIIFFAMMIVLYYIVFTKNQLRNQKVGEIK